MSVIRRKRASALALAALAVVLPVGVSAAASSAPRAAPALGPVLTGRLVVFLHTPPGRVAVAEHRIAKLAARTNAPVKDTLPELGAMVVRPPVGQTLDHARASLATDPLVASVAPEHAAYPRSVPNDPAFNAHDVPANTPNGDFYQWYLRRENFPAAWDSSGGGGTQVAMVDTGFNSVHEDLAPKIVAAVAQSGSGTEDTDGHGSHTAGLACGATNNGVGIASSGYDCGLIIEKASHPPDILHNNETWFTDGEIASAIVDATDRGAEAINLSLGGSGGLGMTQAAIDYAWAHGSIPVVAALNCGYSGVQGYPADYVQPVGTGPDQYAGKGLVVTAAQYDGSRAQFSASVGAGCPPGSVTGAGFGTGISVAAFGDSSTTTAGIVSSVIGSASSYGYKFGTSMATPQVAGLVALIRAAHPSMAPIDVVRAIKLSASGGGQFTSELGWGIIDAGAAMHQANVISDHSAPKSRVKTVHHSRSRSFKVRISSSDTGGAGVLSVSVYVSRGHGKYHLLLTTTRSKFSFTGKRGKLYRFYSRATDAAGNVEPAPNGPESTTRIAR